MKFSVGIYQSIYDDLHETYSCQHLNKLVSETFTKRFIKKLFFMVSCLQLKEEMYQWFSLIRVSIQQHILKMSTQQLLLHYFINFEVLLFHESFHIQITLKSNKFAIFKNINIAKILLILKIFQCVHHCQYFLHN